MCAAVWLIYFAFNPVDVPANARAFNVDHGRSLRGVSEQLAQAGLISDYWSFLVFARLMGAAGEIKAGRYEAGPQIAPYRLLEKIVRGEFAQAELGYRGRRRRSASVSFFDRGLRNLGCKPI